MRMNQRKTKIKLNDESAAPLGCLLGRALLSKEYGSLFYDAKAVELVEKIDYDFSTSDVPFRGIMFNIFLKEICQSSTYLRSEQSNSTKRGFVE